jgi:methylase of polypeptide subunit release factors
VTAHTTPEALGARLRYGGLSPRTLAAWLGTDRVSAVPALLPNVAGRPVTPASALLALFVAGEDVALDHVPELEALHREQLVDVVDNRVHARVAILPLGTSLVVCDRLDTSDSLDIVCWPDDSSYHLALSLPAAVDTWLDLGCGSAFAALLRPELARAIVGADVNPRAVRYARLGCELSGHAHVRIVEANLGDGVPAELRASCGLVTCNAPIPEPAGSPYRARWRLTDTSFVERLFVHARSFVAADGMIVVHAALDALEPVVGELPGHRVLIAYTPSEVRGFAVAWWRPDGEDRFVRGRRPLTEWRPHLTHEDRLAALTRSLSPL